LPFCKISQFYIDFFQIQVKLLESPQGKLPDITNVGSLAKIIPQ